MVSKELLVLVLAATAAPAAMGYQTYSALIPNGAALGKKLGHTDKDYTPFGSMFSKNGKTWAGVCKEKWPGQAAVTVGAVLGDPCCKWTAGSPDFALSEPFLAGKQCASDAKPATTPAPGPAVPASTQPAAAAATTKPPSSDGPGQVQPAKPVQTPAPGPGSGKPGPSPVPAPGSGQPGGAGNGTAPGTPSGSKPAGKPHKLCK